MSWDDLKALFGLWNDEAPEVNYPRMVKPVGEDVEPAELIFDADVPVGMMLNVSGTVIEVVGNG